MDKVTLREAVGNLETQYRALPGTSYAPGQAVRQFNALLEGALGETTLVVGEVLGDSVRRLRSALDLLPVGTAAAVLVGLQLPSDAPQGLESDFREIEEAVKLGLDKTVLLLSGFFTEALLLSRHPDDSTRGPGLQQMVNQAKDERLFGRDS